MASGGNPLLLRAVSVNSRGSSQSLKEPQTVSINTASLWCLAMTHVQSTKSKVTHIYRWSIIISILRSITTWFHFKIKTQYSTIYLSFLVSFPQTIHIHHWLRCSDAFFSYFTLILHTGLTDKLWTLSLSLLLYSPDVTFVDKFGDLSLGDDSVVQI